jgi:SAM-dependent methyltransferase
MQQEASKEFVSASQRVPLFAAVVELPASQLVRSHTLQVARFAGWIASDADSPPFVRVTVGDAEPYDEPACIPRPDVIGVLGADTGLSRAFGFDFYVDLPPGFAKPLAVLLELSDGVTFVRPHPYVLEPEIDLTSLDTFVGDPPILRELARRHLRGLGLEFGALHAPVEVDPEFAQVRYADRLTKSASLELYPDMRERFETAIVDVDFIVDLDHSDLSEFAAENFDFFVANGVIEHLANPLRFLESLHRVMKPGACLLLSVPDRDFAFDTRRPLTPKAHLLADYDRAVSTVCDAHLHEALASTISLAHLENPEGRSTLLAFHRDRGIHVHVWNQASFDEFLETAVLRLGLRWRTIERATSRQALGSAVYILQKH